MRIKILALAALLLAAPAAAQTPDAQARVAIGKLFEALQEMIANLPQYAAPEMDADGNITIRRINPPKSTGQVPRPKDDGVTL